MYTYICILNKKRIHDTMVNSDRFWIKLRFIAMKIVAKYVALHSLFSESKHFGTNTYQSCHGSLCSCVDRLTIPGNSKSKTLWQNCKQKNFMQSYRSYIILNVSKGAFPPMAGPPTCVRGLFTLRLHTFCTITGNRGQMCDP